ncbi:hypothetical protein UK23_36915 [Lentzea aerocolonigenes]|uniref:Lipoprotein n=1 Tax=Lentzea aerocolonigenes TaxID=68170 RepID=A0A0F0GIZ9_LENAE|nr:hypothetical protein [Lentzea aerocolonigenes]KJK42466.1 hypothetical protein UK23_36915 [Lentzea aerocolonigenes]
MTRTVTRTATLLFAALALTACTSAPQQQQPDQYRDVKSLVDGVSKAANEKKTYRFTISPPTAGGVTAAANGSVRLGDAPSLDATTKRPVQTGGPPEELRFVSTTSDTAFVKLPSVFGLPQDKPWLKLSRQDNDDLTNTLLGYHDVIYQQAVFTTYHLPVVQAGGVLRLTAKVADRTRYSIAVDYQKAYDTLTDENLRNEVKLALDQGVTSSAAEIETDSNGLPAGIKFSTQFQNAMIVDEARFTDWGSDVQIAEPNANEVSSRN